MENLKMYSPLEQFEISILGGFFRFFEFFGFSINNFILFSFIGCLIIFSFLFFSVFRLGIFPTSRQYIIESIYDFIYSTVCINLGKENQKFFPYFFFLFFIILMYNVLGLFPYNFTITSQIIFVSMLSFSSFIGLLIIGISKHKLNFFSIFFPSDAPTGLSFLLVPIELVSFFSRPFSLSIRLFANMTAGHILLKILSGFCLSLIMYFTGLFYNFNLLNFLFIGFNDNGSFYNNNIVFVLFDTGYMSYLGLNDNTVFLNFYLFKFLLILYNPNEFFLSLNLNFLNLNFLNLNFLNSIVHVCIFIILFSFLFFFIVLELFVAVLQSYVFFILMVIYLKDILYIH
jgi:F-type H+-transporting ATPase subunit a